MKRSRWDLSLAFLLNNKQSGPVERAGFRESRQKVSPELPLGFNFLTRREDNTGNRYPWKGFRIERHGKYECTYEGYHSSAGCKYETRNTEFDRAAQTKAFGNFYLRAYAFSGGIQPRGEQTLP